MWLSIRCLTKDKTMKISNQNGQNNNYASSSCFIFLNSSFVIFPSPSPRRCNFSREASKSGRGGQGGILNVIKLAMCLTNTSFRDLRCNLRTLHSPRNGHVTKQILHVVAPPKNQTLRIPVKMYECGQ